MTAYDANGNVVSEEGAIYPVRYAYDSQNRRVAMWTNRSGDEWDMTRWAYDPATGLCTSKTYEDGSIVTYEYTPDGLLETTRTADGHWTRNIYDAKRQLVGVQYDDASNVTYGRDAYGRESSAANGNAAYAYTLAPCGIATGESVTIGVTNYTLLRGLDDQGRITLFGIENSGRTSCLNFAYRPDGRIGSVTNGEVTVDYAYSDDGYDTGYTLAVEGGATFVRTLVRDPYRRDLVTAVVNSQGANYAYSYDALSRPATRNDDVFAYNARSEVTGATAGGEVEGYGYDNIGNATFASAGSVTNTYAANGLNQYVAVCSDGVTVEPVYDADGNLVSFGDWSYAYDSAARLTEVRSNGVLVASNYYDHLGRRVRFVTSEASYTFIYDGWNVVLELVDHDGVTDRIEYYWGKDISGSLQGAGGVEGLLYLKHNGSIFVPIYDAYGNVMEYRAADGSLVASYIYDAFGRTVLQTGPLADVFRFRYSTKSFERESGLYYYGKRFYSSILRRWINHDPLEEGGGCNLYQFVLNNALCSVDPDGARVYVIKHFMTIPPPGGWTTCNSRAETVFGKQTYKITEKSCEGEKIGFVVEIIPDDLRVDVYFNRGGSIDFAMHFENDHIGIARQKDAAYHIFKNAVEDIVDCPVPARKQKEALEKELNRTINRLDAENKAFDIPGGPHDVHIPASLNL